MATPVFPTEGRVEVAKRAIYGTSPESLLLKLFKSNTTPAITDTSATYTVADFTGYANKTLTSSQSGGTWSVPTLVSNVATSTYGTEQTWTATSDQTVYGWYIVGSSSGKVYQAMRFDNPIGLIGAESDVITTIPKWQFQ